MKKSLFILSLLYALSFSVLALGPPAITVIPASVLQGEPFMVSIENVAKLSDIKKVTFDDRLVKVSMYQSKPTAFIGIDLNAKIGMYDLAVQFTNGQIMHQSVTIGKRDKIEAPLGIPEKLGGNTPASQKNLVTSLSKENYLLNNLFTNTRMLWSKKFILPVADPVIVDEYGYSRKTGEYDIAHKGTDFRAKEGTKIYAMNRGVVRLVKKSLVYGNMVVVDHGLGLMTFYMHMSKVNVKQGQIVEQGKVLGFSGQTGYATGPHLHLSVRLNNVSIDPMKFMELFK